MKLRELKDKIADARREAIRESKKEWTFPVIKSRGTFLATSDDGGQCAPAPEADCPVWDGTMREIDAMIARVESEFPNVKEIYIGGGYDGAESVHAMTVEQDYQPWVASWQVVVWTRPGSQS